MSEPRTVDELVALEQRGEEPEYLYFWGHQPLASGEIGPSCLSQWWESDFVVDGITYRSAEHWMMASKARLFGDEESLAAIIEAPHPKEAKALGRAVRGFDHRAWLARRFDIVVDGSVAKFGQDVALTRFLLGTGTRVLVEASPVDQIWGIGLIADDDRAQRPSSWCGLNLLGFALMEARSRLG